MEVIVPLRHLVPFTTLLSIYRTAVASMRRTEALASVKFYQILSIFIFFYQTDNIRRFHTADFVQRTVCSPRLQFLPGYGPVSLFLSLILPQLSYGLAAWGEAVKSHLQNTLELPKRVLRLMYFSEPRAHVVPLFTSSKIPPLNMLYVATVSSIMFDVSCLTFPTNISNLFIKVLFLW